MTLLVNIFAGPGAGKSTLAAGLFFDLKTRGVSCELVTEFAKDVVWDGRFHGLRNQVLVLGEQWHRVWRLTGQVDVIVTDSPVLLSAVYAPESYPPSFRELCIWCHSQMSSINLFVRRPRASYSMSGRIHDDEEAAILDTKIVTLLRNENIPFLEVFPEEGDVRAVANKIEAAMAGRRPVQEAGGPHHPPDQDGRGGASRAGCTILSL